ncbi:MAG: eukaryotic-like serine/threonine-protein kinase [Pyrinomonadaceae bacterium]|nr:eukaryotic-like serine/threonine-protein kinase [Pyrinomonadaceae bacterium]
MKKCPKCGKTYENAPTLCPSDGTVLVKTGDALIGQTLAGKYRIEERISEGGMGTVYRATHILMEKAVAIKVLHPSLAADDKIVARFTREAKAASRISNPHALNVTDFGESENGIVFLVMEYLRGKTLKEVIRSESPLPLARIVEVTKQICGALDAAHAEGVVHRDLKSDNIMLEEVAGGNDWAKVLDFGIAKILETDGHDPELTAPNLIIGTPQYMSPEQCSQASDIDARSDIYSLGVILYEMFVGHVPFTGESATAIMLKHLQEAPPSVLDERKDVPPAVAAVIARALSKLPEERQQSAGELAEALANAAAEAETSASAMTSENAQLGAGNTNRIVVPTAPLETRPTTSTEADDATVVHAREQVYVADEPEFFETPPPAASFNPWRIMIPAAVLLVALLGVFFAYQRNSDPSPANNNSQPLTADPNASPVQPGASPTGAGESNITPVNSTPTPASGQTSTGATGATTNPTPIPETTPPVATTPTPDDAGNSNAPQDEDDTNPTPTPTATPRRNPTPPPARTTPTPVDDPPPPTPRATPPPSLSTPASDPPPSGSNLS